MLNLKRLCALHQDDKLKGEMYDYLGVAEPATSTSFSFKNMSLVLGIGFTTITICHVGALTKKQLVS
jgi:hypothetical protein